MARMAIKFRDAVNSLMGKGVLIEEYNAIVQAIAKYSDSLAGTEKQGTVLNELDALTEGYSKVYENKGYGVLGNNFNPWAVSVTPKKLRAKIAKGLEIIKKYKIPYKQIVNPMKVAGKGSR